MNTPGALALKLNVNDLPGSTSRKATFGAIRAAWKSTECAIGALFVSVTRTVWPRRAWMTGPGAAPPNVQALYLIPGAIWSTSWLIERFASTTGPGVVAGSSAGKALWAAANASAFAGAAPAKLGVSTDVAVEPMPAMPAWLPEVAAAARFAA